MQRATAHPDEEKGPISRKFSRAFDPEGEVNVNGAAGSLITYGALVGSLVVVGRMAERELPERYNLSDIVLGGLATHKFSRLVSKASVTSPLRAPFTRFVEATGSAEHHEEAVGSHGVRHTVGELLTCPFCLGVWIGTGYVASLTLAPRTGRAWSALFAVTAVSDVLQHAYERVRED